MIEARDRDTVLLGFARNMRKIATPAERRLWHALRNEALGVKFRRQVPIGPYIVDFFCPALRLVIEVDGWSHAEPDVDVARTAWLQAQGLRVVRFWNNEVLGNTDGVLAGITATLGEARQDGKIRAAPHSEGGQADCRAENSPLLGGHAPSMAPRTQHNGRLA